MKKEGVFNSKLSYYIASMGHKDMLTIVDMGYPIPKKADYVDLVLDKGKPSFIETLKIILKELEIEKIIIAKEMKENNSSNYKKTTELFSNIEKEQITHEAFKELAKESKFFVRTGECTPYSNIILVSGVIF